jgi:hypothetical protein
VSAALLQEAAAGLRERAEAVAVEPGQVAAWYNNGELIGRLDTEEDADFAASMTPAVALAVADLLEDAASKWDRFGGSLKLLTVARAYLGRES